MCGIIYGRRKDKMPIGKTILRRYRKQRERGHEGFGFIEINDGKIKEVHRFEKESDMEAALAASQSSNILFHHRMPTSTPNYRDMTHPIVVQNKELDKDYYVVHNGVLQNEDDLKEVHAALGYEYTTLLTETRSRKTRSGIVETSTYMFNDSEALAVELARFLNGKSDKIDCLGTIAFIAIETDKQGNVLKIHYGRNTGNPLVVEDNNDLFFIKSTGDGTKIDEDEIITIDYKTGDKSFQKANVGRRFAPAPLHTDMRTIGFGAHDRDEEVGTSRLLLSPDEYIPFQHRGRYNKDQTPTLNWDDPEDGYAHMTPEMQQMVDDIDYDAQFAAYQLTDEYLLELWAEIEALEKDLKIHEESLRGRNLKADEIVYHTESIDECKEVLEDKRKEAEALENYLRIKEAKTKVMHK